MIVDDELEILEWLKELFCYDCDRKLDVYGANSGKKALQLLNEVSFDVVLTDIKMPGMDGVALFRKIKENWPKCKVIFLTGYRDFDYIYEIIQNKDVRYVLKSEGDQVIMDHVLQAFGEIDEMLEMERTRQADQDRLERAAVWLRKEFFQRIIYGTGPVDITQGQLEELKIPFSLDVPVLTFLCRNNDVHVPGYVVNEYEIFEQIFEMFEYYMPGHLCVYEQIVEPGYAVILVQPAAADKQVCWERIFRIAAGAIEYTQKNSENTLKLSTLFIIGSTASPISELGKRYEKLKTIAVNQKRLQESVIIKEDKLSDHMEEEHENYGYMISQIQLLESYLELGKQNEYYSSLQELTVCLMKDGSMHSNYSLELYYSISMVILRFINKNDLAQQMAFKIGVYKLTRADEHLTWEEAARYLFQISEVVFTLLEAREEERNDNTVVKVQEYIREHLSEDLTLTRLAEIGCFNASYLSRLFKQVYGYNISDYIMKMRIDRAKELLIGTDNKINEVSVRVGYLSAHSFTRTFKAATGMSPLEYREKYGKV